MRILIIVHALTGGGAERVGASWANGLSSLNHEVFLLTSTDNQTYRTKCVNIIERTIVCKNSKNLFSKLIRKILRPFVSLIQLLEVILKYKPDCIISVLYLNPYSLLLSRFLSGRRIPIIMSDHNAYERPNGSGFKWKQWRNKFIDNKLFDKVTVLTMRDKDILDKKRFNNIEVLNNPLFLSPVSTVPPKEKIILAVGRLNAWYVKGFDLLLNVWNNISDKYPDWKLVIIGDGSDVIKQQLKQLITHNQERIIFKSFKAEIIEEYKKAAIFVLSSRYEGWGLVAIEAMSQGCATLACDFLGRQAEFITDKVNGILCKPDNPKELQSKLEELILDENLRITLQHNAIKNLEKYSEINVAKSLEKIISSVKRE